MEHIFSLHSARSENGPYVKIVSNVFVGSDRRADRNISAPLYYGETFELVLFPSFRTPYLVRGRPDPESRKSLKPMDPGLRRDDVITTFVMFCKGLIILILFIGLRMEQ